MRRFRVRLLRCSCRGVYEAESSLCQLNAPCEEHALVSGRAGALLGGWAQHLTAHPYYCTVS